MRALNVLIVDDAAFIRDLIRKAMIEGDVVEAMISLPAQLFLNTQIECCLWFLSNDKNKNGRDRRNETLFIDARNLGTMKTKALKVLTNEDIRKIQDTISTWKKGENYKDINGYCKSSTTDEIKKNSYILNPGRYVGFRIEEDDGISFKEKFEKLSSKYISLQKNTEELNLKILDHLQKLK